MEHIGFNSEKIKKTNLPAPDSGLYFLAKRVSPYVFGKRHMKKSLPEMFGTFCHVSVLCKIGGVSEHRFVRVSVDEHRVCAIWVYDWLIASQQQKHVYEMREYIIDWSLGYDFRDQVRVDVGGRRGGLSPVAPCLL